MSAASNQEPRQLFKRDRNSTNGVGSEQEQGIPKPEEQAALFVGITAGEASRMGYWIDCTLPAYKGLSALIRTNNQTRVRRERPTFSEPFALRAKREELKQRSAALTAEYDIEKDKERDALLAEINSDYAKYQDEYHKEQCRWLSKYVLNFNPWPFSDIPQPHQEDPSSYFVLYTDLEDLYSWLINDGYNRALAESTGN